jgi:hypothetical protein
MLEVWNAEGEMNGIGEPMLNMAHSLDAGLPCFFVKMPIRDARADTVTARPPTASGRKANVRSRTARRVCYSLA